MDDKTRRKAALVQGMRNGIPIGLGYFAVSFALGIAARNAGLSPFQSFLSSLLCNASAGEYAGFRGDRRPVRAFDYGGDDLCGQRPVSADEHRHEPADGPQGPPHPPLPHVLFHYR